jgi:mRNA interferase MazF
MAIKEHPAPGTIVTVDYSKGFRVPEMVKPRLAVILSPKIVNRSQLCTIVPLSLTDPDPVMPYNRRIRIPFRLPEVWGDHERWIKGDMVNAVGFHRVDLLKLGKDRRGTRIYQMDVLPDDLFKVVRRCVLHGIGCSTLTKHL